MPHLLRTAAALLALTTLAYAEPPATLPGTKPLTLDRPLDEVMVEGIDTFALREIKAAAAAREKKWNRDYSSPEAYAKSIEPNRQRLRTIIGAVDPLQKGWLEKVETLPERYEPGTVTSPDDIHVRAVRWPVCEGITGEGLLLGPALGQPATTIIALPDADWTPEAFAGFEPGVDPQAQLARRFAEQGYRVLVPTLINRSDEFSGHPDVRFTNQPHREFIYRMAFQMGRHVIGYEVQKVLAAVDILKRHDSNRVFVAGVGEGGLLALYSAALEPRIDAALVCGYFQERDHVWEEPIYRNVWNLLGEFGDADLASLVAPRRLVIEACGVPQIDGPPTPREGRAGAAPGRIRNCTVGSVRREFDRAQVHWEKFSSGDGLSLVVSREGDAPAGSDAALTAFLDRPIDSSAPPRFKMPKSFIGGLPHRQKRQFDELVTFTQNLMENSADVRNDLWKNADRSSVDAWVKTSQHYRDLVWDELIGRLPEPTMPANPRSRQVLDDPAFTGYEVVLDVYPDVIAGGILLLPKDLKPGEKRPVVVCQHGLEGIPMHTINGPGQDGYPPYKAFAAELARRGFITYAPQNPYRGKDKFRTLQRKSNPLGRSLFSYILPQHQVTLDWLATLPNVDADRIAFYGLSYGGKTAVRVPPLLVPSEDKTGYCLSICSADFNEWIRKNVTNRARMSYMFTGEYEIYEWNMGHVANYAELSWLMAPRPFMVERGHDDGVAPDEWVGWEYAKVRRHYVKLGIPDRTEIEWFNGPHSINGQATFDFLHHHLNWPKASAE